MRLTPGGRTRRARPRVNCEAGSSVRGDVRKGGQALVETAIALPVLIGLIYAVIAFGRVYGAYLALSSTTRDAARLAAIGASRAEIEQAVHDSLDPAGLAGGANLSIVGETGQAGEPVTVKVTISVTNPVAIPGLPDPMTLTSWTTMRRE